MRVGPVERCFWCTCARAAARWAPLAGRQRPYSAICPPLLPELCRVRCRRRYLVQEGRRLGVEVIDRCNLTGAGVCTNGAWAECGWAVLPPEPGYSLHGALEDVCAFFSPLVMPCPWSMPICVCAMPAVLLEPGQEGLARFLADHRVRVVASLPCYSSGELTPQLCWLLAVAAVAMAFRAPDSE